MKPVTCILAGVVAGLLFAGPAAGLETPEEVLKRAYQADKTGNPVEASKVYREFLKSYPDHGQVVDARYRLAKNLEDLGWVDEAVALLQQVVAPDHKSYPSRGEAFLMLARLLADGGKYEAAIPLLEGFLTEGAKGREDEALMKLGQYYTVTKRFDEAAKKFGLLRTRQDADLARQAAFNLVQLWLRAEKTEMAVGALEEFTNLYPTNDRLPDLFLQLADLFRRQGNTAKAIGVAEQLRSRWARTPEGVAANFILGMCYRESKEFEKAVQILTPLGKMPQFRRRDLGAQALLAAADITMNDLKKPEEAMALYEEAASAARESEGELRNRILEQCYYQLGTYYFLKEKWQLALEKLLLLRETGTTLDVTNWILKCKSMIGELDPNQTQISDKEVELLKAEIERYKGTLRALQLEVYLADRELRRVLQENAPGTLVVEKYEKILKGYPKDVLDQDHMAAYVHLQLGQTLAAIGVQQYNTNPTAGKEHFVKAVREFDQVLAAEANGPFKPHALQFIAINAERAGDRTKTMWAYEQLYYISAAKKAGEKDDGLQPSVEYLRAYTSRSNTEDLAQKTIEWLKTIIKEKGQISEDAREARFFLGELHFILKNYDASARAYMDYIRIYGPKLTAENEVENAPWKPGRVDEKVLQVYEAGIRIAHCWYMQGHPNMVKAYEWVTRNIPNENKHMAEANYWLAMELSKGSAGATKEGKRKLADTLWTTVVNPSFDFAAPNYEKLYRYWTDPKAAAYTDAQKYVKSAMLRAGQLYSELDEHKLAAGVLTAFIERYPTNLQGTGRDGGGRVPKRGAGADRSKTGPDEMYLTARYMLGREHAALGEIDKLLECYKVYYDVLRDDKFRASALQILAFHLAKANRHADAETTYQILLDEYGENRKDAQGEPVPIPKADRLRQSGTWDGIREDAPKNLDLGEIRYALAHLYWRRQNWDMTEKTVKPFLTDAALAQNRHRPQALFMAGQACFKQDEFASGVRYMQAIIKDHANFQAIEEVYATAARGCFEAKNWKDLDVLSRKFLAAYGKSDHKPKMDLYTALATYYQGNTALGVQKMRDLVGSDAYEEIRAEAAYHLGLHYANQDPADVANAYAFLDKSVKLGAREYSCLELGKVCIKLKKWEDANRVLQQAAENFPNGKKACISEAEKLLLSVRKELDKQRKKG